MSFSSLPPTYDDWDEDSETGSCDHCDRENVRVRFVIDPFTADIWPDDPNPPSWWCYRCHESRSDDV